MRILVTGGAGYIGSHSAKQLAKSGHEPVVLDNLSYGHRWAVRWGPFVEMDLADREGIGKVLQEYHVEAVIHFAAFACVGESVIAPSEYFHNNIVNTLNLLDAMRQARVQRVIFSSTCSVYGNPEHTPIREDDPKQPVNPYAESKLMVERILESYERAYGLSWTALRYFNAAGADPDGEIGEVHEPETHLIPRALAVARGDIPELEVFGTDYQTPDGTAVRDYVHVSDLAAAHVTAVERLAQGGSSGAINLGTGEGVSVREVVNCVQEVCGHRVGTRDCGRRAGDPCLLVADVSKAAAELGWNPRHSSLRNLVKTAWEWHIRYAQSAA